MYCTNCAEKIDEKAVVCPHCGVATQNAITPVKDKGGFLWGALGCCVPVVGLILFLVWKDTKPKTAKAAGIGALASVLTSASFYIIIMLLGVGAGLGGY